MKELSLTIILYIILLQNTSLCGQTITNDPTRLTTDTVKLKEIAVESKLLPAISGSLSGKISINAQSVETLPSISGTVDILKLLELTPGIQTSGDGNSNIYVRGADPGQTRILYNSASLYTPGHMLSFFPLFNIDHLTAVDLLKSGANAEFGNFISSAIIAKTHEQIPKKMYLKGNVGLIASQATLALPLGKRFGVYASIRKSYLELLLKPILKNIVNKNEQGEMNETQYDFYDTNITLVGKLTQKTDLKIDLFTGEDNLRIKEDLLSLDGKLKWSNIAFSAEAETQWNENLSLQQSIQYSRFDNKLTTSQNEMSIGINSSITEAGYKNKLSYRLGKIQFNSGLQYTIYNLDPQQKTTQNIELIHTEGENSKINAQGLSAFTSSSLWLTSRWYIEPGVRGNIFITDNKNTGDARTFTSVDLRVQTRYKINEINFVRGSASFNTQYINKLAPSSMGIPTDFWISASDKITPQTGQEYSVGYTHFFGNNSYELSTDIYYRGMKNLYEYNLNLFQDEKTSFSDKILYGTGKSLGWELILKKPAGRFTGWLSYTLSRSSRNFDKIDHGKTFAAKYDRTHDFSVVGSYSFSSQWDASVVVVYATGNVYTQPSSWYFINNMPVKDYAHYNNARMPDYKRTDISINYWFKKNNGINFSIYNVFAVKNPIYVFLLVDKENNKGETQLKIRRKKLFRIVPSISWHFKF